MENYLSSSFWGNTGREWLVALLILVACLIVIRLFKIFIIRFIKKWSLRTSTSIDDLLITITEKSVIPLLYVQSFYFAITLLRMPQKIERILYVAMLFATTFFALKIITATLKGLIFSYLRKRNDSDVKEKQASGILLILNIIIWIIGLTFLIDNLGYNVTTLIAGLGIGGIAIALAAQTILGDLFSYFVIFFDRPFEIGDFIIVDDKLGTIEYIGIKTTHIRALSGEQMIFSNTDLTNARVHNYKRMEKRRVVFQIRVSYQTPYEKVSYIPSRLTEIVRSQERVTLDRAHLASFGEFSYLFEVVYYVQSPDYNIYMDIQQKINLEIIQNFQREEIEVALPARQYFWGNDGSRVPSNTES